MTPLEKLDEAVKEFYRSLQEHDSAAPAVVTGWVIGYETLRFSSETDDPGECPETHAVRYAIGPGTSPTQAAGLVRFLDVVHESVFYAAIGSD